jgi:putative oxidoreductase
VSSLPGFRFFEERREHGPFFVRLVVGFVLVYGTQDNVFSHERMLEFGDFLAARGVPFPLFSAHLSASAQFVCGLLFVFGLLVRPAAAVMVVNFIAAAVMVVNFIAAAVMVVNFIAALVIAHLDAPLDAARLALCMLFSSLFLLFHGAGRLSVDGRLGWG